MSDLVKRLRIKAGMIEMSERIEWGSDTALMREAADALEMAAPDHIADARKMVRGEQASDVVPSRDDLIQCLLATRGQSEGITADAILSVVAAAPAVRGEPVSHDWDDQDKCRRCGDRDWYASATCSPKQQPAPRQECGGDGAGGEHEDDCAMAQPEQPECGCCGRTDRCDDDCDAVVIGGHRAAEQPDVTLLLSLLSHARCNTCDGSGGLYDNHGQPHQCQWCRERSEALAAHRKQETSHENQ